MIAFIRTLLLILVAAGSGDVFAQDSTEPPPPKSSPIKPVVEEFLPRAGGIMVFGGTQGVGLEIVKGLVARNETVTVLARATSDTAALKELGVNIVTGDALDPESIKQAFTTAPFRAAISTLGGRRGDYKVDIEGNKNAIDATKNAGVPRFILLTAVGAGDSSDKIPWYARLPMDWFMRGYVEAKTAAEDYLKATDLDYTIVRPGALLNDAKAGEVTLIAGNGPFSWMTRAELGKVVAPMVEDKSTFKRVFTAYDAKRGNLWDYLTY